MIRTVGFPVPAVLDRLKGDLVPNASLRAFVERVGLPVPAAAYVAVVSLAGLLCFAFAVVQVELASVSRLVFFSVLAVVADRISFRTSHGVWLSPTTIVLSAAVLLLPVPEAVAVAYAGTLG